MTIGALCTLGGSYVGSSQHKPGREAHRLEPGASAQVFSVPVCTREFFGIPKPCAHWEEVTLGRARVFSFQNKPGQEAHRIESGASAQVFYVPGFTRELLGIQKTKYTMGGSYAGSYPGFQFPAQTWLGDHLAAAQRLCPGGSCSWIYPALHQHHAPR